MSLTYVSSDCRAIGKSTTRPTDKRVRLHRIEALLRLREQGFLVVAQVGGWKFRLHESEDLGRRRYLLCLGRLLDEIRREASFELRQARVFRRDREQFLDQFQRLVETARFRERFDRPLEHRETVDGPRVEGHRRDMAGVHNMPLSSGRLNTEAFRVRLFPPIRRCRRRGSSPYGSPAPEGSS